MKTIDELLDELEEAARYFGYICGDDGDADHELFDRKERKRRAVDAKVKELQDRIEELEALAYSATVEGPMISWKELYEMEVDAHELARSSLSPQGKRISELEKAQERWKAKEKEYFDMLIKQAVLTKGPDVIPVNAEVAQMFRDAMSETTPVSEIK